MKKLILLPVILLSVIGFNSCKDEDEKDYNTLKITSGEFGGYVYTFNPNTGFWSPVNETIRQVHLVLGGTENVITDYENKMSILFYYSGQHSIDFPSSEGQWVNFGLTIDGMLYYFQAEDAALTINTLDDTLFEGSLSGTFVDVNNGMRTITFTMDIMINLQQI
jgi:hypothetical protein